MYGKTSVTLTLDELIAAKVAVNRQIESTRELVAIVGDPNGTQAENIADLESVFAKLARALKRV